MVKPKKKVVLFSEIGRVKTFYNQQPALVACVWEYIFFVSKKHANKKNSTGLFICTNIRFFPFKE